jgi:hypothetical protein
LYHAFIIFCFSRLGSDIKKLVEKVEAIQAPDLAVIGRVFSSACYIDDSFPALLYLAARFASELLHLSLKVSHTQSSIFHHDFTNCSFGSISVRYHEQPEEALVANANCGGENCHKGAMLGAVLGAARGIDAFPQRWIDGLREREAIGKEIDAFMDVLFPPE